MADRSAASPAPYAGLFNATGSLGARCIAPELRRRSGSSSRLLPSDLKPPVPVTNLGQYGYALNVGTSPASLLARAGAPRQGRVHDDRTALHGWNGTGALTPIKRFATMFSGIGINNADGTEWYFPQRLTDDTARGRQRHRQPRAEACWTCTRRWAAACRKR